MPEPISSVSLVIFVISSVALLVVVLLGNSFMQLWAVYTKAGQLSLVEVDNGPNSNERAIRDLIDLIQDAQESIEMFDDGNRMEGSIYQDPGVVNAVENKLGQLPEFRVTCYFNEDQELLFRDRFSGHERVTIHAGINPGAARPPNQVHYKIVDGGRIVYLSSHGPGEEERNFQRLDCRKLKGRALRLMEKELVGDFRRDVREAHRLSLQRRATA